MKHYGRDFYIKASLSLAHYFSVFKCKTKMVKKTDALHFPFLKGIKKKKFVIAEANVDGFARKLINVCATRFVYKGMENLRGSEIMKQGRNEWITVTYIHFEISTFRR